ncbi:hypothetical protein [Mycolicibacterium sp. XJ1904]
MNADAKPDQAPAAPEGDAEVHAHLIPGVKLEPPAADDAEVHANLVPGVKLEPPATDDAEVHANLVPGFTPTPNQTTTSSPVLGEYSGPFPSQAPDFDPRCGASCREIIDG